MMKHCENGTIAGRLRRIRSLIHKEFIQVVRDPSSIAIAIVLPVFLILPVGYGLSLDVKSVPVAMVLENPTPDRPVWPERSCCPTTSG